MREPAERNRRALFVFLEFFGFAMDHLPRVDPRDPKPMPMAQAVSDQRRDAGRRRPCRRGCSPTAGRCRRSGSFSMASPITPPRPVGSGQPTLCGRQDAKAAARTIAPSQNSSRSHSRSSAPMRDHAPAPDRKRQHDHDRAEAENLHQEIGRDRARAAEQIADRRVGGVTEARILHRPGRERERRDRPRARAGQARAIRRCGGELRRGNRRRENRPGRYCDDRSTPSTTSIRARRQGDATPPPWSHGPAPWRRGYISRPDSIRRQRCARHSRRAIRASRPRARAFRATSSLPP